MSYIWTMSHISQLLFTICHALASVNVSAKVAVTTVDTKTIVGYSTLYERVTGITPVFLIASGLEKDSF